MEVTGKRITRRMSVEMMKNDAKSYKTLQKYMDWKKLERNLKKMRKREVLSEEEPNSNSSDEELLEFFKKNDEIISMQYRPKSVLLSYNCDVGKKKRRKDANKVKLKIVQDEPETNLFYCSECKNDEESKFKIENKCKR